VKCYQFAINRHCVRQQVASVTGHNAPVKGRTTSRSEYRCVATSIEGFVQQLAVSYIRHGYWFYVYGRIPEGQDPQAVDRRLIGRYGIDISKWARVRRKKAGYANLHYLRCERFFVLCATEGQHLFFEEQGKRIRDARKVPVKFAGYAIGHRDGHPHVRIEREQYRLLKSCFLQLATRRTKESLEREFFRIPLESYAPVRGQLLTILQEVNNVRRKAGSDVLSEDCLRFKRRIVRPFEPASIADQVEKLYLDSSIDVRSTKPQAPRDCPPRIVRHRSTD